MTDHECLDVWRELLNITRLIHAVQAVTHTDADTSGVWRAGLVALEGRRQVLAYVLSLERHELLETVYRRLATELHVDARDPAPVDVTLH